MADKGVGTRAASTGASAGGAAGGQVVFVTDQRNDARALAEEIERKRASEDWNPSESVPGGKFRGTDGRFHDAHGRILDEEGAPGSATPAAATVIQQTQSEADLDAIIKAAEQRKEILAEEAKARELQAKEQEKIQKEATSTASSPSTRSGATRRRSAKGGK